MNLDKVYRYISVFYGDFDFSRSCAVTKQIGRWISRSIPVEDLTQFCPQQVFVSPLFFGLTWIPTQTPPNWVVQFATSQLLWRQPWRPGDLVAMSFQDSCGWHLEDKGGDGGIWGGGNMGKHGERSFEEKMVAQSSSRLASFGHSKNGILFLVTGLSCSNLCCSAYRRPYRCPIFVLGALCVLLCFCWQQGVCRVISVAKSFLPQLWYLRNWWSVVPRRDRRDQTVGNDGGSFPLRSFSFFFSFSSPHN